MRTPIRSTDRQFVTNNHTHKPNRNAFVTLAIAMYEAKHYGQQFAGRVRAEGVEVRS